MKLLVVAAFLLVSQPCTSRSVSDEESVVSVYTTLPTTHTGTLDVYHQIANNIAEKITSPIYRFFGFNTTEEKTTKRPFERIELPENKPRTTTDYIPNNTNYVPERDVEELSDEYEPKSDKKPEKITLFSSYLPVKQNLEKNDTSLELDDVFNDNFDNKLDDVDNIDKNYDDEDDAVVVGDASTPRGPFVFLLELFGSFIQLLYGAFLILFKPSSSE